MVGKYQRKGNRLQWDEDNMKAAIRAVKSGTMGWLLASKTYSVPFGTLRRRCHGTNKFSVGAEKNYLGGKRPTFDDTMESHLVDHIKNMEARFFGFTTLEVRKLAYEMAVQNNIKHSFNSQKKMAGWDWLKGFTKRNPTISLRLPESTSSARARAFNRVQIGKYFEQLERALEQVNYNPTKIWNMDESGLSTVASKNCKVYATKGKKQVGVLSSAERGQHLTVVCAMSASGSYLPPCFIFPRKNMKIELMDDSPPGSIGFAQENGWTTSEIFLKWLKFFAETVKPTETEKVLLVLDGHISHKSLEAQVYAKSKGIVLFCLPPHCTHRVQPLDVTFFGPLSTYYNQEITSWLKQNPGRVVSHFQVGKIFKAAYQKAATMNNAEKGFVKTGIYPFNKDIFPDWMFEPAETTNFEYNQNIEERNNNEKRSEEEPNNNEKTIEEKSNIQQRNENFNTEDNSQVAGPSGIQNEILQKKIDKETNKLPATSCLILPSEISPLPKVTDTSNKKKTKQTF